jgi:hypothetical protein
MTRDRSQAITRSKWFMPAFSLGLGVVVLGASSLGGHPGVGLVLLAIMAGFGLFLVLAGRSETIRGLGGDGRDEPSPRSTCRRPRWRGWCSSSP